MIFRPPPRMAKFYIQTPEGRWVRVTRGHIQTTGCLHWHDADTKTQGVAERGRWMRKLSVRRRDGEL